MRIGTELLQLISLIDTGIFLLIQVTHFEPSLLVCSLMRTTCTLISLDMATFIRWNGPFITALATTLYVSMLFSYKNSDMYLAALSIVGGWIETYYFVRWKYESQQWYSVPNQSESLIQNVTHEEILEDSLKEQSWNSFTLSFTSSNLYNYLDWKFVGLQEVVQKREYAYREYFTKHKVDSEWNQWMQESVIKNRLLGSICLIENCLLDSCFYPLEVLPMAQLKIIRKLLQEHSQTEDLNQADFSCFIVIILFLKASDEIINRQRPIKGSFYLFKAWNLYEHVHTSSHLTFVEGLFHLLPLIYRNVDFANLAMRTIKQTPDLQVASTKLLEISNSSHFWSFSASMLLQHPIFKI